jgi:hypothetical protein
MNFMEVAPRVLTVGKDGWQFIKEPCKKTVQSSPKKSAEDAKKLKILQKQKKEFFKKYGKDALKKWQKGRVYSLNHKGAEVDLDAAAIRRPMENIQRKYRMMTKYSETESFQYQGSGDKEAKKALKEELRKLAVLWEEAKKDENPKETFNDLFDQLRYEKILITDEGKIYKIPEDDAYRFFDRYDFSSAAYDAVVGRFR